MEIDLERLMRPSRIPIQTVSSDRIAAILEEGGWTRAVAGDLDFDTAVAAIVEMFRVGRGLFLTGTAGCGKTSLMRVLKRKLNSQSTNWMYCKDTNDIDYLRWGGDEIFAASVYLDDIGSEDIIHDFGNKVDVVGDFIQKYHYRGQGRFFGTTNFDSAQLNAKYGTRVLDRVMEMCIVLKFNGKSKRERIIFNANAQK